MPVPFQRITNRRIGNFLFRGIIEGEHFQRVFYEEVSFHRRYFRRCAWSDCRFRRTSFRHGTRFENCVFEDCKFELAHTYFGGPSCFRDCRFDRCTIDSVQLWRTSFERCSFSGKLINVVFYGPEAPRGWQTVLRDVDFNTAEFEAMDFRCGIDLFTTRLPPGYVPRNAS